MRDYVSLLLEYGMVGMFDTIAMMKGESSALLFEKLETVSTDNDLDDDSHEDHSNSGGEEDCESKSASSSSSLAPVDERFIGRSYLDIQEDSMQQAAQLYYRFGVRAGDRVLLVCRGNPGAEIAASIACMRINALFVPVDDNWLFTPNSQDQMASIIKDSNPIAAIVVGSSDSDLAVTRLASLGVFRCVLLEKDGSLVAEEANCCDVRDDLPQYPFKGVKDLKDLLLGSSDDNSDNDSGDNNDLGADDSIYRDMLNILYTSGSTGAPKGCVGSIRGLINRIVWQWTNLPYSSEFEDIVCRRTPFTFVDAMTEIFCPLLAGVPLWIPSIEPDKIKRSGFISIIPMAIDAGVTRVTLLPSQLIQSLRLFEQQQQLQQSSSQQSESLLGQQWKSLYVTVVSGEPCSEATLRMYSQHFPESFLINLYGSTEVTGDVCFSVLSRPKTIIKEGFEEILSFLHCDHQANESTSIMKIPIGVAMTNNLVLLLNDPELGNHQHDTNEEFSVVDEDNVAGEIAVIGLHVSHGYFNNPLMSSMKFRPISDKLREYALKQLGVDRDIIDNNVIDNSKQQLCLYLTGDIGMRMKRYQQTNSIKSDFGIETDNSSVYYCLGRKDRQIKIRGVKIELENVESQISRLLGCADVFVTAMKVDNNQTTNSSTFKFDSSNNFNANTSFSNDEHQMILVLERESLSQNNLTTTFDFYRFLSQKGCDQSLIPAIVLVWPGGAYPRTINGKIDKPSLMEFVSFSVANNSTVGPNLLRIGMGSSQASISAPSTPTTKRAATILSDAFSSRAIKHSISFGELSSQNVPQPSTPKQDNNSVLENSVKLLSTVLVSELSCVSTNNPNIVSLTKALLKAEAIAEIYEIFQFIVEKTRVALPFLPSVDIKSIILSNPTFFEFGGNSLNCIDFLHLVNSHFGKKFSIVSARLMNSNSSQSNSWQDLTYLDVHRYGLVTLSRFIYGMMHGITLSEHSSLNMSNSNLNSNRSPSPIPNVFGSNNTINGLKSSIGNSVKNDISNSKVGVLVSSTAKSLIPANDTAGFNFDSNNTKRKVEQNASDSSILPAHELKNNDHQISWITKAKISNVANVDTLLFLNKNDENNIQCNKINQDGNIIPKDQASIAISWSLKLGRCVDASPLLVFHESNPSNHVIFITSHEGDVTAVDNQSGSVIWSTKLKIHVESNVTFSSSSNCIFVSGYFGKDIDGYNPDMAASQDTHLGKIFCLSASTGRILWDWFIEGEVKSSGTLLMNESLLSFGSYDGHLYFLDVNKVNDVKSKIGGNLNGGEIESKFQCNGSIFAAPCVLSETDCSADLISATIQGQVNFIRCNIVEEKHQQKRSKKDSNIDLNRSTSKRLEINVLITLDLFAPIYGTPQFISRENSVIITSVGGSVLCLDALKGTVKWQKDTSRPIFSTACIFSLSSTTSAPIFESMASLVDGAHLVCVGGHSGMLQCINSVTGACLFESDLGSAIYSSPFINGRYIVAATTAGIVHVISLSDVITSCSTKSAAAEGAVNQYSSNRYLRLPAEIYSSPVVISSSVYIGCRDDKLYKLSI